MFRTDAAARLALFESTILPHLDAAYNLARWLTRNDQDAQDIVQEAYLRAFRFFDSFHGGDGKSWLLAVVRNTCFTWMRREHGVVRVPFEEKTHGPVEAAANAETRLVEQDVSGSLHDCLGSLPPEFREVLVMRELEEMPYREIAAVTSLPIGTVMSRLSRARRRMQDCMTGRMKGVAP